MKWLPPVETTVVTAIIPAASNSALLSFQMAA
jgi:hypothetical protein